jgi:predicted site-specific integrase-resolvase
MSDISISEPTVGDDFRVLPFKEWCARKGISYCTGRRLVASGKGPPVVRISARLLGVTVRDDREWTLSRQVMAE